MCVCVCVCVKGYVGGLGEGLNICVDVCLMCLHLCVSLSVLVSACMCVSVFQACDQARSQSGDVCVCAMRKGRDVMGSGVVGRALQRDRKQA